MGICLFLLLASAVLGMVCCGKLKKYAAGELGLIYKKEAVTREQLNTWWKDAGAEEKEYIKDITLSKIQENIAAEDKALGKKTKIQLVEAAGNMNQIMPGKLYQGSLAFTEDEKGCVISKGLAQEMNFHGVGQSLWIDDNEYKVRGILDSKEPVCIIQGKEETLYNRVQIKYQKMPASRAIQMLSGLLPGEPDQKAEGDLYRGLGGILVMLPVTIIFVKGLLLFRRIYRKAHWKPWIKELCSILFPVLFLSGFFLLCLIGVHFSDDYIPGSWSDFSFWTDLITKKAGDIGNLLTGRLDCRDKDMVLWAAGCLMAGVTGAVAVLAGLRDNFTK